MPERQALDIVLRGAAGYMVLARDTITPGASAFDSILVLPTNVACSRGSGAAATATRRPRRRNSRTTRRRTSISMSQRRILRAATSGRIPARSSTRECALRTRRRRNTEDEEPAPNDAPAPAPGNPFGVVPGGARPGTINAPPPRNARRRTNRPRVNGSFRSRSPLEQRPYNRRSLSASMSDIDRFRPDDRRGVDTLYRRTHGADAAEATRLRWDWQHRRNPYNATGQPGIWVAREGPTVVGHYPTLPVRLSLKGLEVDGAWGADAMVAPERDRQGLDEALVRAWDRNSGAVLALGPSEQPRGVLDRLHWPESHRRARAS